MTWKSYLPRLPRLPQLPGMRGIRKRRVRYPNALRAGFQPKSRKETRTWVVSYIDEHFRVGEDVRYHIWSEPDGCHYEIHDGGSGYAFIPAAKRKLANAEPGAAVAIPLPEHTVELVVRDDGYLDSWILPQGAESDAEIIAPAMRRLKPFNRAGMDTMLSSFILFGCALIALAVSLGMYYSRPDPEVVAAEVPEETRLPALNKNMLENIPEGAYVRKLEYKDGEWRRKIEQFEIDPANGAASNETDGVDR